MNRSEQLLDAFIDATSQITNVVEDHSGRIYVSPHVHQAITSARKLLPLLDDHPTRNRIVGFVHEIYKELRHDIKKRGVVVNGKKHPALDASQQAYRIINA